MNVLFSFWERVGILERPGPRTVRATKEAFRIFEIADRAERFREAPHGEAWHTSFHASRFPGKEPRACGRKAMYELLAIPEQDALTVTT